MVINKMCFLFYFILLRFFLSKANVSKTNIQENDTLQIHYIPHISLHDACNAIF